MLGTWGGTDCSSEANAATCTLTMDADKTGITKAFTIIQRTLTITKPANGTITSNPSGINCGESNITCEADFGHGTSVTLTAAPAMNHVIGAWGGDDCSGSGVICVLTINANKTVSKAFIATGGGVVDTDGDGVADTDDVDDDNDGLIEVHEPGHVSIISGITWPAHRIRPVLVWHITEMEPQRSPQPIVQ